MSGPATRRTLKIAPSDSRARRRRITRGRRRRCSTWTHRRPPTREASSTHDRALDHQSTPNGPQRPSVRGMTRTRRSDVRRREMTSPFSSVNARVRRAAPIRQRCDRRRVSQRDVCDRRSDSKRSDATQTWRCSVPPNTCNASSTFPNGADTCTPCTSGRTALEHLARDRDAFGDRVLLRLVVRRAASAR